MGHIIVSALPALLTVLLVGLVLGAGLPALYALGMKATGMGRTVTADGQDFDSPMTAPGRVIAYLCFAIAAVSVLYGIAVIILGKDAVKPITGLFG